MLREAVDQKGSSMSVRLFLKALLNNVQTFVNHCQCAHYYRPGVNCERNETILLCLLCMSVTGIIQQVVSRLCIVFYRCYAWLCIPRNDYPAQQCRDCSVDLHVPLSNCKLPQKLWKLVSTHSSWGLRLGLYPWRHSKFQIGRLWRVRYGYWHILSRLPRTRCLFFEQKWLSLHSQQQCILLQVRRTVFSAYSHLCIFSCHQDPLHSWKTESEKAEEWRWERRGHWWHFLWRVRFITVSIPTHWCFLEHFTSLNPSFFLEQRTLWNLSKHCEMQFIFIRSSIKYDLLWSVQILMCLLHLGLLLSLCVSRCIHATRRQTSWYNGLDPRTLNELLEVKDGGKSVV